MTDLSSNMSPEWVAKVVRENPFIRCVDEKGAPNGNYRTCPVRLSFPHIFARQKPIPPNTEGKYGANLLIPPIADISMIRQAAIDKALEKWPNAGQPGAPKLKLALLPQSENQQYEGYGPEGFFIRATADRRVPFLDMRMAPIVDEAKAYPGAWVFAVIRPFHYDTSVNKGVSFGLQSLMFICDDKQLGGGSNPVQDYAGVNISSDVNPSAAFGAGPAPAEPQKADIFG